MAKRVDANQPEIVEALRSVGYLVTSTHEVGKGFPDIVVGGIDRNPQHVTFGLPTIWLIEIKNPKGKNKLSDDEQDFHQRWEGYVHVVRSVDEALRLVGASQEQMEVAA